MSDRSSMRAERTPAKRDSNAATRGVVSASMTSEFDGPNDEVVHCILERALAAKERRRLVGKSGGKNTMMQ